MHTGTKGLFAVIVKKNCEKNRAAGCIEIITSAVFGGIGNIFHR